MSVCMPCRNWFAQILQEGLSDILEGVKAGIVWNGGDTHTGMVLYEAHFKQNFGDIARNRQSCWICCQSWLVLCNTFRPDLESSREAEGEATDGTVGYCIDGYVRISLGHRRFRGSDWTRGIRTCRINIFPRYGGTEGHGFQLLFVKTRPNGKELFSSGDDAKQAVKASARSVNGCFQITPLRDIHEENDLDVSEDAEIKKKALKVRRFVDECRDSHSDCRPRDQDSSSIDQLLPTRLIEVGSNLSEIRLVETSEWASKNVLYATLSHMWGRTPFISLNRGNLEQFKKNIPVAVLAKTFLEAIQFCRDLHIRYVWIDSMCIIQDSPGDWNKESVMMHRVYGNSSLNIAAAASRNPTQGLFRGSQSILGMHLHVSFDGFQLISAPQGYLRNLKYSFDNIALLKRAWMVQECFLAPRTVYWTDQMLVLRCSAQTWTDFFESEAWSWLDQADVFRRFTFDSPNKSTSAQELDSVWETIVFNYSNTEITLPGDRAVALAGIAARMHELYARAGAATKYAAGCWEHNLAHWLQWSYPQSPWLQSAAASRDLPGLTMPSWSWLNSKGVQVDFGHLQQSHYFFRESIDLQLIKWCETRSGDGDDDDDDGLRGSFANLAVEPLLVGASVFLVSCTDLQGGQTDRENYRIVLRTREAGDEEDDIVLTSKEVVPSQMEFRLDEPVAFEKTQFVKCALLKRYELGKGCTRSALLIERVPASDTETHARYRRIGLLTISYAESERQLWYFFMERELPFEVFSLA